MEIWKKIEGFENYEVSNTGLVRSLNYKNLGYINILKFRNHHKGYIKAPLTKNKKTKSFFIHRLVAIAFIPNPDNKLQVNHINGIKTDNRVENLEWCTNSENQSHAYKNNLRSKSYHKRKLSFEQAQDIRIKNQKGFDVKTLSILFECKIDVIYNIIKNKTYIKNE